ncbi:hypothetical protein L207DRAFT_642354 [Hyaloscypha variabilis F]|uniref:Uncharacterized protein n=1 Tax=Hyaloscypha variabilis (strain UAMH 11265 / GT02V1 / F) TaxID=1149755 RepID=A0A2J6QTM5_HYAVF|nr:hypothetical protein L207DRAFT_642354 [Hyaloscypha variabilis F]
MGDVPSLLMTRDRPPGIDFVQIRIYPLQPPSPLPITGNGNPFVLLAIEYRLRTFKDHSSQPSRSGDRRSSSDVQQKFCLLSKSHQLCRPTARRINFETVGIISRTSDRPQPHKMAMQEIPVQDMPMQKRSRFGRCRCRRDPGSGDADTERSPDAKRGPDAACLRSTWFSFAMRGTNQDNAAFKLHSDVLRVVYHVQLSPLTVKTPLSNPRECSTGPTSTIMSSPWLA